MSAGFTPGHWQRDGLGVKSLDWDGEPARTVATVFPDMSVSSEESLRRMGANAHLIAAAPDLYAKVEIAAVVFEEYARLHLAKETQDGNAKAKRNMEYALEMRAAAAKARGEA